MKFLPLSRMISRTELAKADSDTAYFYDLLLLGELTTKLVVAGMTAAISDDRDRHRYRITHRLVRAASVGEWSSALDELLTGPASQHLDAGAREDHHQLSARVGPGLWQHNAVTQLHQCVAEVEPECEDLPLKVDCRRWFSLFVFLRNKSRGHGALSARTCGRIATRLEGSISLLLHNLTLFSRPWAYLHRNLSGRYRLSPMSDHAGALSELASASGISLADGVYVSFDSPRLVELLSTDVDLSDMFIPNGDFNQQDFELLSYSSGTRKREPSAPYLAPAGDLPPSETEGLAELGLIGECFTNLPPRRPGYVSRPKLEAELHDVLTNDRHPVITLVGRGGIGKTSLALEVLHQVAIDGKAGAVVWLSARDIDLLPEGPKSVRPAIRSQKDMAIAYSRLTKPLGGGEQHRDAVRQFEAALRVSELGQDSPTIFVCDNFETVNAPTELFTWLDTHVRLPNKILITSRFRDFNADRFVEVLGMDEWEANQLITATAARFDVASLITEEYRSDLYAESGGHPYVIKVLLGEVAKARRITRVERIVAGQEEILDALFERTFAGLTPGARRTFLTLCNWRAVVPRVAIEAVLLRPSNERIAVGTSVEELVRSSMIELISSSEDQAEFLGVPLAASVFGRRKLAASPMKLAVEADCEVLRFFGAGQRGDVRHGLEPRVTRLFRSVAEESLRDSESIARHEPMLEFVSRRYPPGWLLLARLHEEQGANLPKAIDAARHFVEVAEDAGSRQLGWRTVARLCRRVRDRIGEAQAIVEQCELPGIDFNAVSESANRLNDMLRDQPFGFESDEKRLVVGRLAEVMNSRLSEADATDCSRLAWLFVHLRKFDLAGAVVLKGLGMDPTNHHLLGLRKRPDVAAAIRARD